MKAIKHFSYGTDSFRKKVVSSAYSEYRKQ